MVECKYKLLRNYFHLLQNWFLLPSACTSLRTSFDDIPFGVQPTIAAGNTFILFLGDLFHIFKKGIKDPIRIYVITLISFMTVIYLIFAVNSIEELQRE